MGESCNHIAALMYAVADITSKRKEGKLACTSIQQKWHVPRKRKISPKKAEQVNFRKYEVSCDDGTPTNPKKARTGLFKPLTETENKPNFTATVNIDRLAEKLKNTNLNIVWLTYFKKSSRCSDQDLHSPLIDIDYQYSDHVDLKSEECCDYFEKTMSAIGISQEKCAKLKSSREGKLEIYFGTN